MYKPQSCSLWMKGVLQQRWARWHIRSLKEHFFPEQWNADAFVTKEVPGGMPGTQGFSVHQLMFPGIEWTVWHMLLEKCSDVNSFEEPSVRQVVLHLKSNLQSIHITCPSVLSFGEVASEVLCSVLAPSLWERQGGPGVCPGKDNETDEGSGTQVLRGWGNWDCLVRSRGVSGDSLLLHLPERLW